VALLAVACGLAVANLYYAQPLLHLLAANFSTSSALMATVVTVTQVGYAAGLLLLLPLGDLLERRRMVAVVLVVAGAALGGAALSGRLPMFEIFSLVVGSASVVGQVLIPLAADLASDERRGRVVGLDPQCVRTQVGDADELEPVVAAEVRKIVRSPQVAVVGASRRWRDEGHIDDAQGGGILEHQAQQVPLLEDVSRTVVPEGPVLGRVDIQLPGIAGHGEVVVRRPDVPEEIVGVDPAQGGAPGERGSDGIPARRGGGEAATAFPFLPFHALHPSELVEECRIEPPLPQVHQCRGGRLPESLPSRSRELQLGPCELRQATGLHDHRPGKGPERSGVLVVIARWRRRGRIEVATFEDRADGADRSR
jgi:hypothetical protein